MPNIESPLLSDRQKVACVIYCCDKKEYRLDTPRNEKHAKVTCQRLACRKHSCVFHQLREKENGKLKYGSGGKPVNRFDNIRASPRFSVTPTASDSRKCLIPDVMIGSKVIDAKFPCDPKKVEAAGFTTPGKTKSYASLAKSGTEMLTPKETSDYKDRIDEVREDPEAMTPDDAEKEKGDCKCGSFQ